MSMRVVIVSENAKTRETLAQAVRHRGGKPTLAGSADEAQRVLETVAADVVLLETRRVDIRARRLASRLEQCRPGCRVVLVTSFSAVRQSPDLLQFDSDDFVGAESLLGGLEPSGLAADTSRTTNRPRAGCPCPDRRRPRRPARARRPALSRIVASGDPARRRGGRGAPVSRELVQEVVLAGLLKDIGKRRWIRDRPVRGGIVGFSEGGSEEHAPPARALEHITFPWNVCR
jgi:CheY-like chemotaxis protein